MTTPVTPTTPAAPKNGASAAAPQTPAAPVVQQPAQAQTPDELTTTKAELAKISGEKLKRDREHVIERNRWASEKKTFGEKLKAADEYERLKREARINKASAAQKLWGEKWREELIAESVNGGTPTAETIAYEMEQREERLRKEFADKDTAARQAQAEMNQKRADAQLRAYNAQAVDFAKANAKDYPIFGEHPPERIASTLVSRIRQAHDASIQRDPETGEVLAPGKVMSFKEAADALEADMLAVADIAASNEKYQPRLREKLTPPKTPGTLLSSAVKSQTQTSQTGQAEFQKPRRTLGNDLTGRTPGEPSKYRTEQQRTADSLAAYHAMAKSK